MKKSINKIISLILVLLMCASSVVLFITPTGAVEDDGKIVITIDPGHGGEDPGNTKAATLYANGDKTHYESRHTYEISLYVKERLLQYKNVDVFLTRGDLEEDEPTPELYSRPEFAAEHNSDAFVSIHTNSYNTTVSGAEIHVPDKRLSYNNAMAVTSQAAAKVVLNRMGEDTGVSVSRGLKYNAATDNDTYETGETADKLKVIRGGRRNNIPVVMLIETCFADNENDFNNHLATAEKRKQMGYAIADGLAEYYNLTLISHATTPFSAKVSKINGMAIGQKTASLEDGIITLDAYDVDLTVKNNQTLTLNGWFATNSGVKEYLYSINNGSWMTASGGTDGEPTDKLYAELGFTNATKNSLFNQSSSQINLDLTKYEGQRVKITVAARSVYTNEVIPFLYITNYTVPLILPEGIVATYGDTLSSVALPRGWSWVNPNDGVGSVGVTKKMAVYIAPDSTRHEAYVNITVNKADPTYSIPEGIQGQFNTKLSTISLPDGWIWSNAATVMDTIGTHTFSAIFIPEDKNNFNSITAEIEIEVVCLKHSYENSCDDTCECGFIRTIEHTYSGKCDGICNVCSHEREPEPHTYANACDGECDVCLETRETSHIYDNEYDGVCNECSSERDVPTPPSSGCGSSISGIIAIVVSISLAIFTIKKKK